MSDSSTDTMTPVFCTAKLPTNTIDALLKRTDARAKDINLPTSSLYLVTSLSLPSEPSPTKTPTKPFETPFLNAPLLTLRSAFEEFFSAPYPAASPFTHRTFIVLDERSARDETCMVVSMSRDGGEARTEFDIPVEVLTAPEMGTAELNEWVAGDEWKDENAEEGVLYTLQGWKKFQGF